jgi:hypothetical protein
VTGELDQISRAIGALEAKVDEGARQRDLINRKLDAVLAGQAELRGLAGEVAALKPHVEDWKRVKQRGLGYLAGAGIGGAGLATGFHAVLKKWGFL